MNRWIALGVVVVVAIYVFVSSIFILDPTEQAVVTRFGQITRIETEPGLYFKVPTDFVERVQLIDKRLLRYDLNNITLQVKGGRFYVVDAFLTYKITDARLFRERLSGSLIDAEQRIDTQFNSALRSIYGQRGFDEALSKERTVMMEQAQSLIEPQIEPLGIDVVDVRILRTDLTDQVSAQTYERMKAERLAEAANLRALGTQQAQTIKAVADRQAVEIVADANRDSNILRGEGDATRSGIFAEAYSRDPSFFAFYRSMEAYDGALSGANTTMLLSPESDFFKFFSDDGASTATVPNAANVAPPPPSLSQNPTLTAPIELNPLQPGNPAATLTTAPPATDGAATDAGATTTTGQ